MSRSTEKGTPCSMRKARTSTYILIRQRRVSAPYGARQYAAVVRRCSRQVGAAVAVAQRRVVRVYKGQQVACMGVGCDGRRGGAWGRNAVYRSAEERKVEKARTRDCIVQPTRKMQRRHALLRQNCRVAVGCASTEVDIPVKADARGREQSDTGSM